MGIPSLLKVGFDGDSTVLLSDEVHLAIKACNKTLSEKVAEKGNADRTSMEIQN